MPPVQKRLQIPAVPGIDGTHRILETLGHVLLLQRHRPPIIAVAQTLTATSRTLSLRAQRSHVGDLAAAVSRDPSRTSWVALSPRGRGPRAPEMKRGAGCADHVPLWSSLWPQACARRDDWRSAVVDRVDGLACIYALEVDRRDPEVCMPELALDDRQRDPFVRHFDRVGVSELVRREPPPHAGQGGEPPELAAGGGR